MTRTSRMWVGGLVLSLASAALGAEFATGVVYHDVNGNRQHDSGEPGLPDVRVSNGAEIVKTDAAGRYRLSVSDDTIIFVIKPRDWMTPVSEHNLPQFHYIHKPNGSPALQFAGVAPTGPLPKSVDFPLYRRPEPERFKVLLFGDTQPYSQEQVDFLAHDVVEQVVGTDAAFGFSLGDLVGDDLDLQMPVVRTLAQIGIPFYNILGNHDMNFTEHGEPYSTETFQRIYGPPYYSFDYGPVHFIVLEDIIWEGANMDERGKYRPGLGERQMTFVRNDLKLLPKEQLVVLTMHIPMVEFKPPERDELFAMLAEHPNTVSFSAHWHVHATFFMGPDAGWPGEKPHHHTVITTTCGSWWRGAPDEAGLPHTVMRDGTPNGWLVATFDGNQYAYEYRPARRPANYQMRIYTPESVPAAKTQETEVVANVFIGTERSTVRMRVDNGPWTELKKDDRPDPFYMKIKEAEESDHPPRGVTMPRIADSTHIWVGHLPAGLSPGAHLIEVRSVDMFGVEHVGHRVFRVE